VRSYISDAGNTELKTVPVEGFQMAAQQERFPAYPLEVRSSMQRSSVKYTLLPDFYALHRQSSDMSPSEDAVTVMNEGEALIEVFQGRAGERKRTVSPDKVGPVYTLHPGGTLAIPTGRVFIRFREGVHVEDRLQEIKQAGYEIAQGITYAPHASWLQAHSGKIADALTGVHTLEQIAQVENVEPQMLMHRASRSTTSGKL
jgi:hypothetical protein